jgi:hypothetical protein
MLYQLLSSNRIFRLSSWFYFPHSQKLPSGHNKKLLNGTGIVSLPVRTATLLVQIFYYRVRNCIDGMTFNNMLLVLTFTEVCQAVPTLMTSVPKIRIGRTTASR